MSQAAAAVVTVGSELTLGLQVDTNSAEIAAALTGAGLHVAEIATAGDELPALTEMLRRLTSSCRLVVVTGGLGPTHDDITREAASQALSAPLERDERLAGALAPVVARHRDPEAAAQTLRQAFVLRGARVLDPTVGTAPGQIAETPAGHLVLLPGPPREMRPMLEEALHVLGLTAVTPPAVIGTTGLPESDVQVLAQRALGDHPGVALTVLARPGEVRVVLAGTGADRAGLRDAERLVAEALGEACFSSEGETLAEAVLRVARASGTTISTAESCTGGMVAAALTDVPGSSEVFLGGFVAYGDASKSAALGVRTQTLADRGAVSAETALEMAAGARDVTGAEWAVSTTGIAGPSGGTEDKPVGTVWFAVAGPGVSFAEMRMLAGDRPAVRIRATAAALDILRLAILEARS